MSSGEAEQALVISRSRGQAVSSRNRKLHGSRDALGQESTLMVAELMGFHGAVVRGSLKQR